MHGKSGRKSPDFVAMHGGVAEFGLKYMLNGLHSRVDSGLINTPCLHDKTTKL